MDPASVSELLNDAVSLATSIGTAARALTQAGAKRDPKAVAAVLELVSALNGRMVELQTTVLQLKQENSDLRAQIRQEEERTTERQQYQRKQMRGSTVLVRDGEPDTYYCTTCQGTQGLYLPLQPMPPSFRRLGSHRCAACGTLYHLL